MDLDQPRPFGELAEREEDALQGAGTARYHGAQNLRAGALF